MKVKEIKMLADLVQTFPKERKMSRRREPTQKDPDVAQMLLDQINKGKEAEKLIEILSKGMKKDEKKEDKKDELTILQKTVYIVLSSLVGVPLYVYFLMMIGQRMAEIVR